MAASWPSRSKRVISSGEYAIGNEENPIRTELVVYDGLLLVGTYNGQVSAVQVIPAETRLEPPDGYLQKRDFASAAAALALQGNFRQAAELYAQELKDIYKLSYCMNMLACTRKPATWPRRMPDAQSLSLLGAPAI